MRVCIVEDNDVFREMLSSALLEYGFDVAVAADGEELYQVLHRATFDAFILDLNLPGEDGLSIAERLKGTYPDCFVLMATARERLDDRVAGYARGADVYMVKPLHIRELVAALQGFERRLHGRVGATPGWFIDTERSSITAEANSMSRYLTHTEMILLKALVEAPGRLLETWTWFDLLGREADLAGKRVLEVHIVNLRRKLIEVGVAPPAIQAVRTIGYHLLVKIVIR